MSDLKPWICMHGVNVNDDTCSDCSARLDDLQERFRDEYPKGSRISRSVAWQRGYQAGYKAGIRHSRDAADRMGRAGGG